VEKNKKMKRLKEKIEKVLIKFVKDNKLEIDKTWFPLLQYPPSAKFGDLTTNIAFKIAKEIKTTPQKIAQQILNKTKDINHLENVEIAKGGYVNFFATKDFFLSELKRVLAQKDDFGRLDKGKGKRVQVEFCSANPTGPLTIASGRQTAIGDVLANVLAFAGYSVEKEYFVNDSGTQIENLGKSIYSRYCELFDKHYPIPEEGYYGEYIVDIAKKIKQKNGDMFLKIPEEQAINKLARMGSDILLKQIKQELKEFGTEFDVFFSQYQMEKEGKVDRLINIVRSKNLCYQKEGALWFRTTESGDDKDRVLIKSDKTFTYRTVDMAYHVDKYRRGFGFIIDLFGPDHHSHSKEIELGLRMLGYNTKDTFRVLVVQHCTLYRGKQKVKVSKRAATYITLKELLEEVGKDAVRYFFVDRKTDTHLDFDIEIAKKKSLDNPVYYVQYAHARISSIFKKGIEQNLISKQDIKNGIWVGEADLNLAEDEELELVKEIIKFEEVIEDIASSLEPQMLTNYVYQLATKFQKYYQLADKDPRYKVLSEERKIRAMRLAVISGVKIVLKNCLRLLGISAPEYMEPLSNI
jgi:arginyl-tRNA synthetase